MSIKAFEEELISSYDASDSAWGRTARDSILKFYTTRPGSAKDPKNLTGIMRSITNVRRGVLSAAEPIEGAGRGSNRWQQLRAENTKQDIEGNVRELKAPTSITKEYNDMLNKRKDDTNTKERLEVSAVEVVTAALEQLSGDSSTTAGFYNQWLALCLLTGRRQEEIHKKSTFAAGPTRLQLAISNLAKSSTHDSITVPCLAPNKLILRAIKEHRSNDDYANKPTNAMNVQMNNACKRIFPNVKTVHALRAVYAEICAKLFNREPEQNPAYYKMGILGHADVRVNVEHYDYKVTDMNTPEEVDAVMKLVTKGVAKNPEEEYTLKHTLNKDNTPTKMSLEYVPNLYEMMRAGVKITSPGYRATYKGSSQSFKKLYDLNKTAIDKYNDSLTKEN